MDDCLQRLEALLAEPSGPMRLYQLRDLANRCPHEARIWFALANSLAGAGNVTESFRTLECALALKAGLIEHVDTNDELTPRLVGPGRALNVVAQIADAGRRVQETKRLLGRFPVFPPLWFNYAVDL